VSKISKTMGTQMSTKKEERWTKIASVLLQKYFHVSKER
jgi:hypothetical protein